MSLADVVSSVYTRRQLPGAVALVARGDDVELAVSGSRQIGGGEMSRDTVFRIASVTKPILAAAAMALIERGTIRLDDPVADWLPELAHPVVLRDPHGPIDDVVPSVRPITVRHLLTLQGGLGLTERFDTPISEQLFGPLGEGPPRPQERPVAPGEWMRRVAAVPLVHQPGEGWTYNTGLQLLGVLLARAVGRSLPDVLAELITGPVGMGDTAFWTDDPSRLPALYRRGDDGELILEDAPDGQWTTPPPFPSGAGGLLSTADDLLAFGRMVLGGGTVDGRRVLTEASVRLMTTAHVDGGPQHLFLDGQGWGFGAGVDIRELRPMNVIGRYGWVGGTGTAWYVIPATDTVVVWLSQVSMANPDDFEAASAVLSYAAR